MSTFDFGFGPVPAHRHAKGGGWVADTAHVDETVYVGPDAQVYGNARVSGNAQVYGNARVSGNARVWDDARVSGNAQVYGNARVSGNAQVCGNAWVYDNARVCDNARVYGTAWIGGDSKISKTTDYLLIGPIGSRDAFLTWTRSDGCIATGCFRGPIKEFLAAVEATHGDNQHAKAYRAAVRLLRAMEKAHD